MFKKNKLEVISRIAGVEPTIDAMVAEPFPGFQVEARSGSDEEVLEAVAAAMIKYLPDFHFNNRTRDLLTVDNEDLAANGRPLRVPYFSQDAGSHLDTDFSGVAVHKNKGRGKVVLGFSEDLSISRHLDLPLRRDLFKKALPSGRLWHGTLNDGVYTIFSESIFTDTVTLQPTFHDFTSDPGVLRTWERSAYTPYNLPEKSLL